ncbi:MAG: hypothetical protein WC683_01640 [bacterium]
MNETETPKTIDGLIVELQEAEERRDDALADYGRVLQEKLALEATCETLQVLVASAEGAATGYKAAVADLAARLQLAEAERDARALDEEWRAKRIEIQKLRDKCEQMRKNLIAVDARADERYEARVVEICAERDRAIAAAQADAAAQIATAEAGVAERIATIRAEAAQTITERCAQSDAAARLATVAHGEADARAAAATQRAEIAERNLAMVRQANVHRVDALRDAVALTFAWERRDTRKVKSADDLMQQLQKTLYQAIAVAR